VSKMTTLQEHVALSEFAERAARSMENNKDIYTYSDGQPAPGQLLALRWGLGNDCVLVVRLDDDFEPVNFQQAIRADGGTTP